MSQKKYLGGGSYGAVYKVIKNGKNYAQKKFSYFFRTEFGIDPQALMELDILDLVRHPNVLNAEEITISDECKDVTLLLPLMDGGLGTKIDPKYLPGIIHKLLCGIKYLHDNHIVHLDIKNQNILVADNYETVKIADFGMSRITPGNLPIPYGGKVVTSWFRPPEVLLKQPYSYPVDIWSLGIVFYIIITGTVPFSLFVDSNKNMLVIISRVIPFPEDMKALAFDSGLNLNVYRKKQLAFWEKIPDEYVPLLKRMLEADPSKRATADECFDLLNMTGFSCPQRNINTREMDIIPIYSQNTRSEFITKIIEEKYKREISPIRKKYIQVLAIDILDRFATLKPMDNMSYEYVDACLQLSYKIFTTAELYKSIPVSKAECEIVRTLHAQIYRPTIIDIMDRSILENIKINEYLKKTISPDAVDIKENFN